MLSLSSAEINLAIFKLFFVLNFGKVDSAISVCACNVCICIYVYVNGVSVVSVCIYPCVNKGV